MADVVEQVMQEMVPDLDDLRKKNIFSEEEIRHIVRRRRDFEYSLQRKPGRPQDVLNYVRYEIAMESLRRRRSDGLRWRKKSRSDYAGINHIHHIFSRGTKRYKQDLRLWYQHLDFCLRSGSSNVLTRVLMKAVKYHPRQVSLWLLAADRELQQGHVDAARKLLMRGLRCLPTSAKLLGEFLRLEVGVAGQLLSVQDMEDEVKVEQKDVWGPTKLVFKKGLTKLEGKADATATFLSASLALLQQARSKWASSCGFQEWSDSLTTAAASRRPGLVDSESPSWAQVSDETAVKIWEVWWKQELQAGTAWSSLVETISSCSIPAVLLKATKVAREEGEDEALKALVSSEAAVSDPQSTLSILQELSVAMAGKKALQAIFQSLLQRAVAKHPTNLRLVMVAGDHEKALALLDDVTQLSSQDAASSMLLKRKSLEKTAGAAPCGREVEQVLRAIEQGQDVAPALLAVLSEVTAHKGAAAFAKACREIRKLADNLWDVPKLRALILQEVLEVELRLLHVNQAVEVKDVAKSFEELLSAVGPSDVFVWLRYLEFAQEVFGAAGAPSPSDLHLRALRSVKDQDLYREKAQQILQGLDL